MTPIELLMNEITESLKSIGLSAYNSDILEYTVFEYKKVLANLKHVLLDEHKLQVKMTTEENTAALVHSHKPDFHLSDKAYYKIMAAMDAEFRSNSLGGNLRETKIYFIPYSTLTSAFRNSSIVKAISHLNEKTLPDNPLQLMKQLEEYKALDPKITAAANYLIQELHSLMPVDENILYTVSALPSVGTSHQQNELASPIVEKLEQYITRRSTDSRPYQHYFLCIGLGKSLQQKRGAVQVLIAAITRPSETTQINKEGLETLRNGQLGNLIRNFVKSGDAQKLLGCGALTTVRDFVNALNLRIEQSNPQNTI